MAQLLSVHDDLEAVEALVVLAPGEEHQCMYSRAQQAAAQLRVLGPHFQEHWSEAARNCYSQCMWELQDALMAAPANFCGPGSTLLHAPQLDRTASALLVLRRWQEADIRRYMAVQLRCAGDLPAVAARLVRLRTGASEGVNVGLQAAWGLAALTSDDMAERLMWRLR